MNQSRNKFFLFALAGILIFVNLTTFALAFNETAIVDSGCCTNHLVAKDFSALYVAAWQMCHNPSAIYSNNNVSSLGIYPRPEPFKYLPSILFLIAPLTALKYHDALIAFDLLQVALLVPIALLLYSLLKGKKLLGTSIVMLIALLEPSPLPGWGLSATYYWQWAEGQTKVLLLFLLLLSFYLGKTKKLPVISGIVFGYTFFDPRFALISIPLFVIYNRERMRLAILSTAISGVAFNALLFAPGVGSGFIAMVFGSGLTTPVYPYAYIPLLTIIALSVMNWKEIFVLFNR